MEFLPVLDPLDHPKAGIWYSLIPSGSAPGVSVGHNCVFLPSKVGGRGKILIVGGANPSGSFSDTYAINLDDYEWNTLEWKCLKPRYEHCTFVTESNPQTLWVFGGAQQCGNRNCLQSIDLNDDVPQWNSIVVKGEPPSARTYHTNSACIGDRLYVFSGGESGAVPVSDSRLHIFDTESSTWSQPETEGRQPAARHGHIIVAVGSTIYIHGGMAGDKFYNDMYSIDSMRLKWEKVRTKGDIPPGVAAHSAVVLGPNIYIFGGLTADGAINSMHKFNTERKQWVLVKFEGDLPPNRLDHSMCLIPWQLHGEKNGDKQQAHKSEASDIINLAFVFGGMDTHGVIHNDCVVTVVK
ncbi:Rab9 effector protein with kelch motifs [Oryzias melastigma]|uniref:Rab9 effector protein with kelch motifs n=1 Tax=Oryzias melastigma TaxID=30732 RepID=A0A834CW18_ORYME|nr:Rab9 effector protein with kelch motifs [Oryzias melastigma]